MACAVFVATISSSVAIANHQNNDSWHQYRNGTPQYLSTEQSNNTAVAWGSFDGQPYKNWNDRNPYTKFLNYGVKYPMTPVTNIYVWEAAHTFNCAQYTASQWAGCQVYIAENVAYPHFNGSFIYLNRSTTTNYTARQRQSVLCHELGHALGLMHINDEPGGHSSNVSCTETPADQKYLPTANDTQALDALYGSHSAYGSPVDSSLPPSDLPPVRSLKELVADFCAGKATAYMTATRALRGGTRSLQRAVPAETTQAFTNALTPSGPSRNVGPETAGRR